MKKTTLLIITLLFCVVSYAQNFNYQAVVRDASNNLVVNQSMTVLVRIIAGGPTGSVLYNEEHTIMSNAQGVITFPVGAGTSGANFQAIDWSTQNHWIDIQVDLAGGNNYTQIGTSKLQFVPYAMYALNSAEAGNAGIFAKSGTVVSNGNGNYLNDDFVFGSDRLDYFSTNSPLNARMFYDKSKRAFRAGFTFDDEWDEANIGDYSVAFGEGGLASGRNSFSMGRNANATGLEAVAFGTNAGGFGDYSRGFGLNARANGVNATAIGRQLNANSMAEIQLGQYSKFVSGSANTWVPTDRLFVIGNGQEDVNQALNSDALVMLKNGNTTLNGQLTLDGDNEGTGRAFTLPAQDGTANQIMQTDGSGNVTWVTPATSAIPNGGTNGYVLSTDGSGVLSWVINEDADADPTNEIELPTQTGEDGKFLRTDGTVVSWQDVPNELPTGGISGQVLSTDGSGVYTWINQTATAAFTTTNNVTSNSSGDTTTDDFVFGSTQIDDIPGVEDNNRIVFDKSNAGAFRAGSAFNTNRFNQDQMGAGSVAFGVNNLASGTYAASTGSLNIVSGYAGYAHGERNTVSSSNGVTTGADNIVTGSFANAHGRNLTSESLYQTTFGTYNTPVTGSTSTFVATDRLFVIGNGTANFEGVNASDAFVMLKNGNTTLNGQLTIDGDNQGAGNAYTLPAQDGTVNQVMTTDGSGNVSWADAGTSLPTGGTNGQILSTNGSGVYSWVDDATGTSAFTTTSNVTSNTNGTIATDDFVFGSTQLADDVNTTDDNIRMFFDKSKGAFRAGFAENTEWDDVNVGSRSVAFGNQNTVSGFQSFAVGAQHNITGATSASFGTNNTITGIGTFSTGEFLTAEARSQVTIGYLNTTQAGNALIKVPTDRLLVIGNGVDDMNRSDALVMLKNGNTTLNGQLTIDGDNQGAGNSYTLPAQDGTANQVMTTDGSGNVSWSDVASGSAGAFSTIGNVTSNANGTIATNDFVFGSTQLDNDTNTVDDDKRIFFDKGKGAIRAGEVEADEWDAVNVGAHSTSFGINSVASGNVSTAIGDENQATGYATVALGIGNTASGDSAVAIGSGTKAESRGQISLGVNNTEVAGTPNIHVATDRLFVIGNGITNSASDALVMLKNGNTTLNGTLTIDGDNTGSGSSYTLPAQDGTANQVMTTDGSGNVSWANAVANGVFSTTANVTSNANGTVAIDDFVFGSIQLDNDTNTVDDDNRMFFNKSKGAFRVGHAESNDWNDEQIGVNSMALGYRSIAAGNTSIAIGRFANALSDQSISIGHAASGNAFRNISIGYRTYSASKEQITMGSYNTIVSGDSNNWVSTDRLFVIGNGDADNGASPRSDALVMLKNGNTTLNGQLTIDGDNQGTGRSYTLPAQDGAANQIMSTDGSGNISWITSPIDADSDPTNEIELPAGGTNGQVLQTDGFGGYSWIDNTVAPGAYTAATMASGWEYYNAAFSVTTFQDPRFRKVNNVVTIEGLCRKSSAISNGETIMTLPAGFRPTKTRIFTVQTENGAVRVDVNPNGTVVVATGFNVNQNWVSLDGLTFSVD